MANRMVVDTETANTYLKDGALFFDDGQVYDCCCRVINDDGETLEVVPIINKDVFFGMKPAMREAYFADKYPQYMRDIWDKKYTITDTWGMRDICLKLIKKWDVQSIIAHNARFDVKVLNATMRYQTKSKRRFFFPYQMEIIDTMKLAQNTICKTDDYISFCKEHGYMTAHPTPRPRASAEVIWRYLTKNDMFEEEHTGVGDTEIEAQIYAYCMHNYAAAE